MLFFVFFAILIANTAGQQELSAFRNQVNGAIDESSLVTCWMYGTSNIKTVRNDPELGHLCDLYVNTWTADDKQAMDLCQSRFPYHITNAKPDNNNGGTHCTIQINLKCENGFWQIHGKCYMVTEVKFTWAEAPSMCPQPVPEQPTTVAQFYSKRLALYLNEMTGINDAWVKVPLADYYDNGVGDVGVYVQDGGYKYDVKKGTIIMDDLSSSHQVLCEYTPPMTKAETYYIAGIYSEIYPIEVHSEGAIIPSSSYHTIQQTEFSKSYRTDTPDTTDFSTKHFDETCLSIGRILNVESYPISGLDDDFKDVRGHLTQHRFYMTNMNKNAGCLKTFYKKEQAKAFSSGGNDYCEAFSLTLNTKNRYPTMAGMRAPLLCTLHTYDWEYGDCPPRPPGFELPIPFTRANGKLFCHYAKIEKDWKNQLRHHAETSKICAKHRMHLSGFDSQEEVTEVRAELIRIGSDDHLHLGIEYTCEPDCKPRWRNHVAVNHALIKEWTHLPSYEFNDRYKYGSLTTGYRLEQSFHGHPEYSADILCGQYSPSVRQNRKKKTGALASAKG